MVAGIAVCLPLFFWLLNNSRVTAHNQLFVPGQERSIDDLHPSSPIELHPSGFNLTGDQNAQTTLNGKRRLAEGASFNKERTNNLQADAPSPMPHHHHHGFDSTPLMYFFWTILLLVACSGYRCQCHLGLRNRFNRIWNWIWNRIRIRNRNMNQNSPGDRELQPQNQPTAQ